MTMLHTHRRKDVSLADALADALAAFRPPKETVALVYAPRWCGFARLVGGKLTHATGPVPADAFEVRVFTPDAELRWLKNPASADGSGAAVILGAAAPAGWTRSSCAVTDTIPATYLLWGKGTGPASAGWGQLAEARVGGVPVPLAGITEGVRVVLHAVEYVGVDEYGSAYVCEERLTELTINEGGGRD